MRDPLGSLWRMVFTAAALAGALGLSAMGADLPKSRAPSVEGLEVAYYNGDVTVRTVLVLDELRVSAPAGMKVRADTLDVLLPGATAVATKSEEAIDVQLAQPAGGLAALDNAVAAFKNQGYAVEGILYPPKVLARDETTRQILTNRFSVKLEEGVALADVLAGYNVSVADSLPDFSNTYILEANGFGLLAGLEAANALYESGLVEFATPLIRRQHSKRAAPNDPMYPNQWHLSNTGQGGGTAGNDINVESAWGLVTGSGVNVAIVDDGLQTAHPDLSPNARIDIDIDINYTDLDPTPDVALDNHGTACAGVAGAKGNNNVGVAGAAYDASLVGVRLISLATTDGQDAQGLGHQVSPASAGDQVHVSSNSWGPADDARRLETFGPLAKAAVENAITNGRGGLGTIFTWAAGNGRLNGDNVNYDGYASSRYTIAVGATTDSGVFSYYSEPGASMLVNTPSNGGSSGITTTDRTGADGYNNGGDYTSSFSGTSSACPLAAGVVALTLEANPGLTWRDVQHILVNTATQNDPGNSGWFTNGAGLTFNHGYGFGRVDAAAAVATAVTWANVGVSATPLTASGSGTIPIPDNDITGISRPFAISGPSGFKTEHAEVTVNITHPWRGDLKLVLTSPNGTASVLADQHGDDNDDYSNWMLTTVANWSENPNGIWTLTVSDLGVDDTGTLNSWSLRIHGYDAAPAPQVTSVVVVSGQVVRVTYDIAMGPNALTPGNYTISGAGQGTLASNPDSVTYVGNNTYQLVWITGIMVDGGDVTITVDPGVVSASGTPIGSSNNSGTHVGGGTTASLPVRWAPVLGALLVLAVIVLTRRRNATGD